MKKNGRDKDTAFFKIKKNMIKLFQCSNKIRFVL